MTPADAAQLLERGYRAMAGVAAHSPHQRIVSEAIADMRQAALRARKPRPGASTTAHLRFVLEQRALASESLWEAMERHREITAETSELGPHEALVLLGDAQEARQHVLEPLQVLELQMNARVAVSP